MILKQTQPGAAASWRNSRNVCALSDDGRHLGHIVRAGDGWLAFDARHLSDRGSGFLSLGFFCSITTAKEAVQAATLPLKAAEASSGGRICEWRLP